MARRNSDSPIKDPILAVVKPTPEPVEEELIKGGKPPRDLAAGASPSAGRTSIEEAKRHGPTMFLKSSFP